MSLQQQRFPNHATRSRTHFPKKCRYIEAENCGIFPARKNIISEKVVLKMKVCVKKLSIISLRVLHAFLTELQNPYKNLTVANLF